jgi:hypothetical protein
MRLFLALAISSAFLFGCGDDSSGGSGGDAGDGGGRDATMVPEGDCFPTCGKDGSGGPDDVTDENQTCADLASMIESMQAALRACVPQMPNQCSGLTPGPCCGVSVDPGTSTENFDQAVMAYRNQCMPDCGIICPMAPSNMCDAIDEAGTIGTCQ